MISSHWKQPTERDLRMFDVLAQQAADLIERRRSEQVLREMESTLRSSASPLKADDLNPLGHV
jgi:GAF domain-containing protein